MKIICLNPPFKTEFGKFSRTSRSPAVTKSGTVYYPIWLCYAAGSLEKAGHKVKVIDSCAERINITDTIQIINEFNPDLVLLDTSTPSILSDLEISKFIKENVKTRPLIVLMGTHPSSLPAETLKKEKNVDVIVRGEADETICNLADALSTVDYNALVTEEKVKILKNILGISFQVSTRIYHNNKRPQIQDLDSLPFVSQIYKKHLKIKEYFFAACDYPEVQIMSARGCTDRCTFCVYPYAMHDLKYRMRSAKNIVDEFEWVERNMPEIREIGIEDDTFAGSIKRVHEFCNEKIKRGIKLKWYTNVRVGLELDTLKLMKKANCVLLTVGYESANQEVLDAMKKRTKVESIIAFSKNTKKAGIMVHSCFMVGNPKDTRESLRESLDLALKLNDDTMQFFPLIVYPGTPDYEWAKENDLMTVESYDQWVTTDGLHNSVVRMPDMTQKEIVSWCDYARKQYY
ncbi:MAG: radical SAM protein, partial [Flavobacteriaceae bacterium]|nr:radical SAM protein [Flavobacteriaceae bacterium]